MLLLVTVFCFYHTWIYIRLVNLSDDVEKISVQYLTICHLNLNSIASRNFIKIAILKAYSSVHNMDIECLSEIYLDSSVLNDDHNLQILGYSSVKLKTRWSSSILQKLTAFKINRRPISMWMHKFRIKNWGENCFCLFIDHLAKKEIILKNFWEFRINVCSWQHKYWRIKNGFGFNQIIDKPAHILSNSSSGSDLIFTSQPNLVIQSGVHSYLHANCHHQTTYEKFDLNVVKPLLYGKVVWHYELTSSDCIQRAIANFDCEKTFHNVDVNKQGTVVKVIRNFIPHETLTFDDRGQPE